MDKNKALKLALEVLDWMYMPGFTQDDSPINNAITALREALAQPQQEPVAWMFQHEETGRTMCVDVQQVEWGFEKCNPRLKKIAPLYTTPPAPRQWVGLTDVNAVELWQLARHDIVEFARVIEAKLKEKNT